MAGLAATDANLATVGLTCVTETVDLNTTVLALPPGQSGVVTARVTCVVNLADLILPGLPGRITVSEVFSASTDPYVNR